MILIPSTVWRVGKPNVAIRKAAVVCIIKMLEQKLIDKEKMHGSFKNLFDTLKNCIDDDWANDIRYASVILVKTLINYLHEQFEHDEWVLIYPELLKRLDDAQDGIRIETCKVFEIFFEKLPDPWSSSLYEYTINNIFVHLDDQNTAIQEAVSAVLRKAARVQTHDFIKYARAMAEKSAHPALCQSLCDYAQETYKQ